MPRTARIDFPGALHHIIQRGNNKQPVFLDSIDYTRFTEFLKEEKERRPFLLYTYVLMPNHFHLLTETLERPIAQVIQPLLTRYALYFNRRHKRVGHLFQNRPKEILCQKEAYLLELVRYIPLNPVRAGLVKFPEQWPYSSFFAHVQPEKYKWVDNALILPYFDTEPSKATIKYTHFIMEKIHEGRRSDFYPKGSFPILGDAQFKKFINEKYNELRRKAQRLPKFTKRFSLDELILKVSKFTNVSTHSICGPGQTPIQAKARALLSYVATQQSGHQARKVAEFLSRSPAAVTTYVKQIENELALQDTQTIKELERLVKS